MNNFILNLIEPEPEYKSFLERIKAFFSEAFKSRFNNVFGYILLSIISFVLVLLMISAGYKIGIVLMVLLVGVPLAVACMLDFTFGIMFTITISFFLLGVKRIIGDIQVGLLMDFLIVLMFFGLIIKQIKEHNWDFAKNPISKIILVWVIFNLLEAANPSAASVLAWVYTVRSFAGIMILYFLLTYAINTKQMIAMLIAQWIVLTFLATLYGYYQEYVGMQAFELQWIKSSPERYALLYQAGKFRKFSFFSDPLVFGILLSITGVLCIILSTGPFSKLVKRTLTVIGVLMLYGMLFSGTRAAYVLPIVGFVFYAIITLKKRALYFTGLMFFFGFILVKIPTSNANLVRFQSAFNPTNDASYKVRVRNQAFIKPFIQSHPMGGGLGSVGEWGKKFAPWSPLSNFPPDSGFVRVAAETGWMGLLLYVSLLFTAFYVGIRDYFRIRDPELKCYSLALLTTLFCLTLANFPQEAIGQYPISLLFFVAIAVLNKCRIIDREIVEI